MQFRWKYWENQPQKLWLLSIIGLFLISGSAFLYNLGSIGLIDKTEALYVEIAHQIILTNNWIIPQWNGNYFYDYPIGGSWLMAISLKIFGVSEWAARLPVAFSAIAVVFLSFYTLRFFGHTNPHKSNKPRHLWITAWIGSAIVALNPAWIAFGRIGVSDMLLSSNIAIAMLAFFLGYAQPNQVKIQQRWYIAFPIFMGIASLIKGPIGIILPVLGISCFLIYIGKFGQVFREIRPLRTLIILGIVTLPWYITASLVDANFVEKFLGFSNFSRFTNVLYNHPGPWYFYIIYITVLMLPWSVYLPIAITHLRFWQIAKARASLRHHHLGLFAFFWFLSIFLFFSAAATKLPGYILPAIPAVAIIIGLFWGEQMSQSKTSSNQSWFFIISSIINILILIVLAIASAISPNLAGGDPSAPTLASNLRASGLPVILTIIWSLAAVTSIFLLLKKDLRSWLWSPNLGGFLAFITFVLLPLIPLLDSERQQPFRQLSIQIKEKVKPEEEVFLMGFTRYSIVYYSQHKIEFFDNVEEARNYLKDFNLEKSNPSTILIVSESKFIDNFGLNKQSYELIGKEGVYQLIRVSKDSLISK